MAHISQTMQKRMREEKRGKRIMRKNNIQIIILCLLLGLILIFSAVSMKELEQENEKLAQRIEQLLEDD